MARQCLAESGRQSWLPGGRGCTVAGHSRKNKGTRSDERSRGEWPGAHLLPSLVGDALQRHELELKPHGGGDNQFGENEMEQRMSGEGRR